MNTKPADTALNRFRALDALRGFAALAVALGHVGTLQGSTFYLAVDFFLVLSGFVLTHAYFWDRRVRVARFAWLRLARMYPLHLLTLLLVLAIFHVQQRDWLVTDVILNLLFIQNMGFGPHSATLNAPSWSIAVEYWINLGAMMVIVLLGGLHRKVLLLFGVTALFCLAAVLYGSGHLEVVLYNYKGVLNSGLVRCIASFCIGVLAYTYFRLGPAWRSTLVLDAMLLGLFAAALLNPYGHTPWEAVAPFLFAALVINFARPGSAISRGLTRLGWFGDISFSVYLTHVPVLLLMGFDPWRLWLPPPLTDVLPFVAVVLVVSSAVYYLFEMPVYGRLKRYGPADLLPGPRAVRP